MIRDMGLKSNHLTNIMLSEVLTNQGLTLMIDGREWRHVLKSDLKENEDRKDCVIREAQSRP